MSKHSGKRLHVAHIVHTGERGGAELALLKILTNDARDWSASVVMPRGDRGIFSTLERDGVVIQSGKAQRPGASGAGLRAALGYGWTLLRQGMALRCTRIFRRADVVHANSTRAAVYSSVACLLSRKPLVVHLRDRIEPGAIGRFGFLAFTRLVLPRASAVIANSNSTAETVRPYLRKAQSLDVIPSPIGMDRVRETPTRSSSRVRVGMVARLDPWKGQAELIQAFARANVDGEAELVFIGDAAFGHQEYQRRLREMVTDLTLKNVSFAGFQYDVQSAIDNLDICVQYSTRPEPLGQNVLQYLSRGRATVVAAEGGPLEWIVDGENGMTVTPRDIDALASAIRQLVLQPELRRQISEGAINDTRLLSDADICEAHGEVFRRVKN